MRSLNIGKFLVFGAVALVSAFVFGLLGAEADIPWWLVSLVIFAVILAAAFVLRHNETGRWSYERRSWTGEHDGRQVELIFDEKLMILNRLSLRVDGKEVDKDTIFYGTKELSGDGVTVAVGSGWTGECTGAVIRTDAGERALTERAAA